MKKKLIVVFLAVIATMCLMLALSACGGGSGCESFNNCSGLIQSWLIQGGPEQSGSGQTETPEQDDQDTEEENGDVSPHVHEFSGWTLVTPVTCESEGVEQRICACGESEERTIAAIGHNYIDHPGQPATCTDAGWEEYRTCSRCDYSDYEEVAALGHSYVYNAGKAATCTEIGWEPYRTCTRCGVSTYRTIAALGHSYIYHMGKEATCTEIGWEAYQTCARCDYSTYRAISAFGHHFEDGFCTVCGAEDETYVEELSFELSADKTYYKVVGLGSVTSDNVVIPDTYNGLPVKEIEADAFHGKSLVSITISINITTIGKDAFAGCGHLESVYYEGTVADWVAISFGNVFANPLYFGHNLYIGGLLVQHLIIPEGVTQINAYAFAGISVIDITISLTVELIGADAFGDVTADGVYYTGNVSDWVAIIFESPSANPLNCAHFMYIGGLLVQNLIIPEGVTQINAYAFGGIIVIEITINVTVNVIGEYAFANVIAEEIYYTGDISEWVSITFVNASANPLYCCHNLYIGGLLVQHLVIPEGVTQINAYAFAGIVVVDITISVTVAVIETGAFYEVTASEVVFSGTADIWGNIIIGGNNGRLDDVIFHTHSYVDGECIICGRPEPGYNPSDGTAGLEYALSFDGESYCVTGIGTATATHIVIPSTYLELPVTQISAGAFEDCKFIVSVVVPESVIFIGDKAFAGCEALIEITIPDGTEIGTDVFRGTINVTIIYIHELVFVPEVIPSCGEVGNVAHYVCTLCGKYYADAEGKERLYNVEYTVDHEFVDGICINCGTVSEEIIIVSIDNSIGYLGKFALGTLENAIGLPEGINVTTADGVEHTLTVVWDLSGYVKNQVGTYIINGVIQLGNLQLSEGLSAQVEVSVEIVDYMYGTADIVFVIDNTGSMSGYINSVKNNINDFASALEEAGVSARWAVITYRDITADGNDSTKIIYNGASAWYSSAAEFETAISSIGVDGGGDNPETAIDGLMTATTLETRKDVRTFYILVTDAGNKDDNNYGVSDMNELADILAERNIYTSVVAPSSYQSDYEVLVDSTGGVMTTMNNFSAVLLEQLTPLIFEKVTD